MLLIEVLTGWESISASGWHAAFPPSKCEHETWIREVLRPRIELVAGEFRPLLCGSLEESENDRWSALRCVECTEKIALDKKDEGSVVRKKREASPLPGGSDVNYMQKKQT